MNWSYVSFSISEGSLGLFALLVPVPFLMLATTRGRWLVAGAPGLVGAACFVVFAVASGLTTHASPGFFGFLPLAGLLLCLRFVLHSVGALRNKWVGLLHLFTVAGAIFTSFVAAVAITHDWL
jgi:hypothetical protein